MKIIAFYLPQFHDIPENDEWWGKGFTEWVNVKKAQPLYKGHEQPRIPMNENYYNLLDDNVKIWQANIAKEYGIYGFCYYHYWFGGKLLLEKPMEQMLANPKVDIPFCISWANEPWTKAWVNESKVLIPQFYGGKKEWKEHFDYLLPFFKDNRYIKEDNKPLFIIYRAEVIDCLNDMLDYWTELARQNGFSGMKYAYQNLTFDLMPNRDDSRFDYNIEFQPSYAWNDLNNKSAVQKSKLWNFLRNIKRRIYAETEKRLGFDLQRYFNHKGKEKNASVLKTDYDEAWKLLVSVRLAAQCTDARVNVVVEDLYAKFPDVNALADAPVEEIEEIVRPCGLGKSKARDISACMKILRDEYNGKVPDDFDKLLKLPGVGRKSANLIMGDVFGKPAIVTDTHCIRLCNRIGLVDKMKDPKKVEMALWKIIPPEEGNSFCHRLVNHGREVCTARTKPYCDKCCLQDICKKVDVK